MNNLDIELIINEVVKRLELKTSTHKVLLLIKMENEGLKPYLERLKEKEYCISQILMFEQKEYKDVPVNCVISYSEDNLLKTIAEYERIVVSGLSLKDLDSIICMDMNNDIVHFIFEALRQGKAIDVITEVIDWSNAKTCFADNILKLIYKLESFGISFPNKLESKERLIDKDIITRQDLKRIETGLIIVKRKAIFTESALKLIAQRKIEIIRQ